MLLPSTSERQGRLIDQDSAASMEKQEAGRLLLMAVPDSSADESRSTWRRTNQELLRFITCGSVDDGKTSLIGRLLYESKMIFDDQFAALESDSKRSAPRETTRLGAAGGRADRRARAGHHHRRGLPLLHHRAAQVHRGRHPGPRAVHAQHGHRRLDRGPRGDSDRCPQGRADPDPPAQLPGRAAGHPHASCWPSTRWTWWTTPRSVRPDRRRIPRRSPPSSGSPTSMCIPMSAVTATTSPRPATRCPGTTGRAAGYLENVEPADGAPGRSRSACRCSR